MLPIGSLRLWKDGVHRTKFTRDEQITLMTLWSIARSPLIVGGNLPDNDEFTLSLGECGGHQEVTVQCAKRASEYGMMCQRSESVQSSGSTFLGWVGKSCSGWIERSERRPHLGPPLADG